jgi:hypothetical protein
LFLRPLADSFTFLTLTRLVVVIIFENFSFALFTPPLGDYQTRTHSIGFEGSVPPSGGIPLQIVPVGLGNVLGYLGSVARASAM